jgi:hypothetical protein
LKSFSARGGVMPWTVSPGANSLAAMGGIFAEAA